MNSEQTIPEHWYAELKSLYDLSGEALDDLRDVMEGWTDPVIDSYEERCDRARVILSETFAALDDAANRPSAGAA